MSLATLNMKYKQIMIYFRLYLHIILCDDSTSNCLLPWCSVLMSKISILRSLVLLDSVIVRSKYNLKWRH